MKCYFQEVGTGKWIKGEINSRQGIYIHLTESTSNTNIILHRPEILFFGDRIAITGYVLETVGSNDFKLRTFDVQFAALRKGTR